MAGFPYHALDTYLPKLIRAGERVAICDQLEMPKQTTSSKRGITEMVVTWKRDRKADGTGKSRNRTTHQSKEIGLWERTQRMPHNMRRKPKNRCGCMGFLPPSSWRKHTGEQQRTEPTVARMQQPLWHQGYGIVVEEWRRVWSLYG